MGLLQWRAKRPCSGGDARFNYRSALHLQGRIACALGACARCGLHVPAAPSLPRSLQTRRPRGERGGRTSLAGGFASSVGCFYGDLSPHVLLRKVPVNALKQGIYTPIAAVKNRYRCCNTSGNLSPSFANNCPCSGSSCRQWDASISVSVL
jgi:hypothetical protein